MSNLKRNLSYLVAVVGVVFIWRGIWGLADIYLLPNLPVMSLVVSIVIGIFLLLLHDFNRTDLQELDNKME